MLDDFKYKLRREVLDAVEEAVRRVRNPSADKDLEVICETGETKDPLLQAALLYADRLIAHHAAPDDSTKQNLSATRQVLMEIMKKKLKGPSPLPMASSDAPSKVDKSFFYQLETEVERTIKEDVRESQPLPPEERARKLAAFLQETARFGAATELQSDLAGKRRWTRDLHSLCEHGRTNDPLLKACFAYADLIILRKVKPDEPRINEQIAAARDALSNICNEIESRGFIPGLEKIREVAQSLRTSFGGGPQGKKFSEEYFQWFENYITSLIDSLCQGTNEDRSGGMGGRFQGMSP